MFVCPISRFSSLFLASPKFKIIPPIKNAAETRATIVWILSHLVLFCPICFFPFLSQMLLLSQMWTAFFSGKILLGLRRGVIFLGKNTPDF